MEPEAKVKKRLKDIEDHKILSAKINKLIKNKIQPLAFKHYVLRTGKGFNSNKSPKFMNMTMQRQATKQQQPSISKQNACFDEFPCEKTQNSFKKSRSRRKALAELQIFQLDSQSIINLQKKVQRHIILKKMDLMETQFFTQENNKKPKEQTKENTYHSPLHKYLELFKGGKKSGIQICKGERELVTCEQMLKKIKSAKSIKIIQYSQKPQKQIQCMFKPVHTKINNNNVTRRSSYSIMSTKKQFPIKKQRRNQQKKRRVQTQNTCTSGTQQQQNKKLRTQILIDIKKEYENQKGARLRLSINHRKMIQVI